MLYIKNINIGIMVGNVLTLIIRHLSELGLLDKYRKWINPCCNLLIEVLLLGCSISSCRQKIHKKSAFRSFSIKIS